MKIEGKMFPYKHMIEMVFETAGRVLDEDFSNVSVSLNFVDGAEIQRLNREFREIDKQTDVLSFPNLNKTCEQKLTEFEGERDVEDGTLFLGDIVICKKIAYLQAKEYRHSRKREVCFLALHGLLHLLGFDHIKKSDEKLMQSTAEKILKEVRVNR